jgi:cell wall-associated NlpC family hydrolase
MPSREAVIAAARGWLGTPFRHQGRVRGVGVDCGGLVVMAAREAGCSVVDHPPGYPRCPDGASLQRVIEAQCAKIGDLEPAAVALMRWEDEPQHVGLIARHGDRWTVIHAIMEARRVVEHGFTEEWAARLVGLYRLPGIEG